MKRVFVAYLISLLLCISVIYSKDPPGSGGTRPCNCQGWERDWCVQWCGTVGGQCDGEVFRTGCWCRNPSNSWLCDCEYYVLCNDGYIRRVTYGCEDLYCGLPD
jgi:hypothetical protein